MPKLSDPDHVWFSLDANGDILDKVQDWPPEEPNWYDDLLERWQSGTVEEFASKVSKKYQIPAQDVIDLVVETIKDQMNEEFSIYQPHLNSLQNSGLIDNSLFYKKTMPFYPSEINSR